MQQSNHTNTNTDHIETTAGDADGFSLSALFNNTIVPLFENVTGYSFSKSFSDQAWGKIGMNTASVGVRSIALQALGLTGLSSAII